MSIFARISHPTPGGAARRRPGWRSGVVALSAMVLMALIPMLEVNGTHLFNPDWPSHARFHEAWQLLTNAGLAAAALWLALARGRERLAAGLVLIVVGSLILACAFVGLYGGAITRPGGDDLQLLGVSLPVLIMSALALALLAAVWPRRSDLFIHE